MIEVPCVGCRERSKDCHLTCERYNEYREVGDVESVLERRTRQDRTPDGEREPSPKKKKRHK